MFMSRNCGLSAIDYKKHRRSTTVRYPSVSTTTSVSQNLILSWKPRAFQYKMMRLVFMAPQFTLFTKCLRMSRCANMPLSSATRSTVSWLERSRDPASYGFPYKPSSQTFRSTNEVLRQPVQPFCGCTTKYIVDSPSELSIQATIRGCLCKKDACLQLSTVNRT